MMVAVTCFLSGVVCGVGIMGFLWVRSLPAPQSRTAIRRDVLSVRNPPGKFRAFRLHANGKRELLRQSGGAEVREVYEDAVPGPGEAILFFDGDEERSRKTA